MKRPAHLWQIAALASAMGLLAGCAGGPGRVGPVVSALSFPLNSAYRALVESGYAKNVAASSTSTGASRVCSGTGSLANSPAVTPATFEGKPVWSSATTGSMAMLASPDCKYAGAEANPVTHYYNSRFELLGRLSDGRYDVYLTPRSVPASVKVGDSGTIGKAAVYKNSTKATGDGSFVETYVVEADTSTSAILNEITTHYDAAGKLHSTEQLRYRISAAGVLTPVRAEVESADGDRVEYRFF